MSLPGPPPQRAQPQRGPMAYRFRYVPGSQLEYHTIKSSQSGTDLAGVDWTLTELARLWTGAQSRGPRVGAQANIARMCRWNTVKMLRVLRLRWENPGATVPAPFASIAANPRVSTVGAAIGSKHCANKRAHIDIDWFGPAPSPANTPTPAGQKPSHNWWKPVVDGAVFERSFAESLLHYLEDSLGLQASGAQPAAWSWPPGIAPGDPLTALTDPAIDQQVLARAGSHGFEAIRLVWYVGNQRYRNPPSTLLCDSVPARPGKTFVIKSPDANAPDPNG